MSIPMISSSVEVVPEPTFVPGKWVTVNIVALINTAEEPSGYLPTYNRSWKRADTSCSLGSLDPQLGIWLHGRCRHRPYTNTEAQALLVRLVDLVVVCVYNTRWSAASAVRPPQLRPLIEHFPCLLL